MKVMLGNQLMVGEEPNRLSDVVFFTYEGNRYCATLSKEESTLPLDVLLFEAIAYINTHEISELLDK